MGLRYRNRLSVAYVVLIIGLNELLFRKSFDHTLRQALWTMGSLAVIVSINHWTMYWDVLPDRVVRRMGFSKKVWLLSDIASVARAEDELGKRAFLGGTVFVRNNQGKLMLAHVANPDAFINEIKARMAAARGTVNH